MLLGIIVVEDVFLALYLALLQPVLGDSPGGLAAVVSVGRAMVFLVAMFAVARWGRGVVGRLLSTGDDELLTVCFVGLAILVAGVAANLGVSEAIGAFLAGQIVAGSVVAHRVERLVLPIHDLLAAIFFFAFGLSVDPAALADVALPVAAAVVVTVVGNLVAGVVAARLQGSGRGAANIGLSVLARASSPSSWPAWPSSPASTAGWPLRRRLRADPGRGRPAGRVAVALVGPLAPPPPLRRGARGRRREPATSRPRCRPSARWATPAGPIAPVQCEGKSAGVGGGSDGGPAASVSSLVRPGRGRDVRRRRSCRRPQAGFGLGGSVPRRRRPLERRATRPHPGRAARRERPGGRHGLPPPRPPAPARRLAGKSAPAAPSAASTGVTLWTGGTVPYTFDASVSAAHQRHILDATAEWGAFANVRFAARAAEADYVTVKDVPGLVGGVSSVVGAGGQQFLQIGSGSWDRLTLLHEIGHTLGLQHEHQRSDRDTFVTILTANIVPGKEATSFKLPTSNFGAYDFLSVMHYARNRSRSTLRRRTPSCRRRPTAPPQPHGHPIRPAPSALDRAGMATAYGPPRIGPGAAVTNTNDSGPGSLRAVRCKRVAVNGVYVVAPEEYTAGFVLRGTGSTVKGLVVHGFNDGGVRITGTGATSPGPRNRRAPRGPRRTRPTRPRQPPLPERRESRRPTGRDRDRRPPGRDRGTRRGSPPSAGRPGAAGRPRPRPDPDAAGPPPGQKPRFVHPQ